MKTTFHSRAPTILRNVVSKGDGFCLAMFLLLGGCAVSQPADQRGGRFELFVLGIAQDGGRPHLGCSKSCCEEARRLGRTLYPASLGIHDVKSGQLLLVEVTPAVQAQVALLHRLAGTQARGRRPVDGILITHAHIGHYSGLVHFGREVAATDGIPTYVTPRLAGFLSSHGPWEQLVKLKQIELRPCTLRKSFQPLPGLQVTAIPVPHRDEYSDTVAFQLRGSERTVLFLPDIDYWQDELLAELLKGVDVAYLDGTFYDGSELPGRDLSKISHPRMVQTMERLGAEGRAAPGRFRFIHLNHTNPALLDRKIQAQLRERGFRIAKQGERICF